MKSVKNGFYYFNEIECPLLVTWKVHLASLLGPSQNDCCKKIPRYIKKKWWGEKDKQFALESENDGKVMSDFQTNNTIPFNSQFYLHEGFSKNYFSLSHFQNKRCMFCLSFRFPTITHILHLKDRNIFVHSFHIILTSHRPSCSVQSSSNMLISSNLLT